MWYIPYYYTCAACLQCLWLAGKVLYGAQFVVGAALGWVDTNAIDLAAMCLYLLKMVMCLYLLQGLGFLSYGSEAQLVDCATIHTLRSELLFVVEMWMDMFIKQIQTCIKNGVPVMGTYTLMSSL